MTNILTMSALLTITMAMAAEGRLGDRWRKDKGDAPATETKTIEHGGREREYVLYVPASYAKDKAAPVVFIFHGGLSSAEKMVTFSDFTDYAERDGYILVFPSAVDKNWNDGRGNESMTSQRENVDDVGLVAAILDSLKKTYSVDAKRVYATGISNGGLMSQRLAIERSDLIAAIAPVAGSIAAPIAEKFAPKDPVSVIMFNGTEDPIMPFDGGVVSRDRGMVLSSKEVAAKWVERNKCKGPKHDNMPDQDPDDKCTVERDTWTGGENGTEVILYTVKGGGHTWPGGRQYAMPFLIGVASQDANATELIWDFFKKHKKP